MEDLQRSLSLSSASSSFHPLLFDSELWLMAEQRTQEILCTIEPVLASDQKRREVIDYIRRLIQDHFATEVYPFGSVPLKTYLPDGDIDLTALAYQNMEEDLARDVFNIFKCAEQDPKFQVKDVQYIQAQVKIVRCSIKNISVDISFNQMAGLYALFFLEKVDEIAGKNHLLKRSIILIKAWCFYESRILGASYGLLSTYALDVMILHIINLFHSSLPGPLAVLWRFLEYYSTFDWDNYCISINGPIAISSFREIGGSSEIVRNDLLLSQEFLWNCRELFSVPIKAFKNIELGFPVKHLNIVDPLKDSNNLGRSVSRAGFRRIRCTLSYGAKELREIFMSPAESMGRLENFFVNTLNRNGRGERPDVLFPVPAFGIGRSEVSDLCGDYANYFHGLLQGQWHHHDTLPVSVYPSTSLPSQIRQKGPMGVPFELTNWRQYAFSPRAVDEFVPGTRLCRLYTWPQYTASSGSDQMGRSRGIGTYIPDVTRDPYRKMLSCMWRRKSSCLTHCQSLMSSQKIGRVEDALQTQKTRHGSCLDFSMFQVAPETEGSDNVVEDALQTQKTGNASCLDFSVGQVLPEAEKSDNGNSLDLFGNQFPLLPCTKKPMSSDVQSCDQPTGNAPTDEDCSAVLEGIQFGTLRHLSLPLQLPSFVARKQNSEGSTSMETTLAAPKLFIHVQPASMENADQMVLGQQYQLKNAEDFPPLCKSSIPGKGAIPRTIRMGGEAKLKMQCTNLI